MYVNITYCSNKTEKCQIGFGYKVLRQVELADRVIKRPVSLTSLIQSTNPFADGAGHTTNKPYIKGKIDTHIDQFPNSDHVVMVNFLKRTFSVCHN